MSKPHKHAEMIKAWADGAEIQTKSDSVWLNCGNPEWYEQSEYRIKQKEEPKPQPTKMLVLYNKYQHRYEIGMAGTYWNREQFDLIGNFEVNK